MDNCLAKDSTVYMEEVDFFALTLGSKQTIKYCYQTCLHVPQGSLHNITALKQGFASRVLE